MNRSRSLLAVPLLALGLAACGSTVSTSGFKGEAHAVAQRISDYQADIVATDEQKLCSEDLSRAVRAQLSAGGSSCKQALKRQLSSIDDYEVTVAKVAVSGATATAIVKSAWSGKSRLATLELVKEGGGWRIAGASLK
jgi:outer membrane lipoprotein-sorting protein